MERRVAGRVLGFLIGSAGVVMAVFVVLPWLEAPQQSAHQPEPREASLEEVLASSGEEESVQGGETDGRVEAAAADLTAFPSPLLPVDVDSPMPGPAMESPEATAFVTSGALPAESERDTDKEDDSSVVDLLTEEAQAVVESTVEGVLSHMADKTVEPLHAESVVAESVIQPAPAAQEVVDGPAPTRIEPMPVVEIVRIEQPQLGEAFAQARAAREPSRTGLPRLEFEMPDDLHIVGTPSVGGDTPDAGGVMMTPVEPLSEFSPRPFARSHMPLAADAPAPDAGLSGPVLVPHTLRGVMGYRLPLISRQEVPDQVVSGVLIPAHTTYVILQPGYWELVGLSPEDVNALRVAAERSKADQQAVQSEPADRGWNPLRLFKRRRTPSADN